MRAAITLLLVAFTLSACPKPAPAPVARVKVPSVFDVPALMGENIDGVRKVLGKPSDDSQYLEPTGEQMSMGLDTWDNNWSKGGYNLLVTFNPQTGLVTDFFIAAETNAEQRDWNRLLPIGNLTKADSSYYIERVRSLKDRSRSTGIKIVPVQ